MATVVFISGPSGVGKTTLVSNLGVGVQKVIHQDAYFVDNKPRVMLSNGVEVKNWDSIHAVDFRKFNEDIMNARFGKGLVIVEGFCLRHDLITVVPDVHIHLSYVSSEKVEDIFATSNDDLCRIMVETRKKSKPSVANDEEMVRQVVLPFYKDTLRMSNIDYVVPAFINWKRVANEKLYDRVLGILAKNISS